MVVSEKLIGATEYITRAGLCPWDNRGKANSWRRSLTPPIMVHKNLQTKNAKLCNIVTATSLLN
jgi:hypothetical protein